MPSCGAKQHLPTLPRIAVCAIVFLADSSRRMMSCPHSRGECLDKHRVAIYLAFALGRTASLVVPSSMPGTAVAGLLSLRRYEAMGRPTGVLRYRWFSIHSRGSDCISRPTPGLAIRGTEDDQAFPRMILYTQPAQAQVIYNSRVRVQAIEIQPLVFVHRSFEHVRDMSMAKASK